MVPGGKWLRSTASMSPFFPARHLFPGGIEAVFPVWLAADLDQNIIAHEVLDLQGQPFLVVQDGRAVEVPSACKAGQGFAFDQAIDYGLIPD